MALSLALSQERLFELNELREWFCGCLAAAKIKINHVMLARHACRQKKRASWFCSLQKNSIVITSLGPSSISVEKRDSR